MKTGEGRLRAMWISGINVASEPPHSPTKYASLLNFIHIKGLTGKIGNTRIELTYLKEDGENYSGTFIKYAHIDQSKPWYDSEKKEKIVDSEGNPVPQVREGMGHDSVDVHFVFSTEMHKLLVDTKNMSIKSFHKAFSSITDSEMVTEEFGIVNTSIIPSSDAIERVLSIDELKRISYKLTIPNTDIFGTAEYEKECFERLNHSGIGRVESTNVAQHGTVITPDKTLLAELSLASRNGYVSASGKDKMGNKDERSTLSYPKKEKTTFGGTMSRLQALESFAKKLFNSF